MKAHEKKKLQKRVERDQVKSGKINDAGGQWVSYQDSNAMHRHQRKGYKL